MKKKYILKTLILLLVVNVEASVDEFKNHIDMAADQKMNMNSRWTSLIKSADFASKEQVEDIKKFTENKEWYLRNAALVALNKIDHEQALKQAEKLVKDKALVVRSAAVEILAQDMNEKNKKLLVDEVDQNYNYNKKSSLWIRKQILEKIAKVADSRDQKLFVKNLFDNDKSISELSAKTLEQLTGRKFSSKKFVENWRQYAKQNNWF